MRRTSLAAAVALALLANARAETLELATGDGYAPFADSRLPGGGLATELVRRAFAESKVVAQFDWVPWARGFAATKAGRYAGTFPYIRSAERERDFLYSAPIYEIHQRAFARTESALDFSNLASLVGSTICVPLGWEPPAALLTMIRDGQILKSEPKDISTCAQMVASRRADYFVTGQHQGRAAIDGAGLPAGTLKPSDAVLGSKTLHLIVGRNTPDGSRVIATFDKGLEALKKRGDYDRIVADYAR
ncbi:substrate-binding periplasmic protein [Chitinimonas koreensis]|uniref:substrate-binding periplasmic protein n=1 Tax=Chitinimonas koreensis TaxID=356302 RepID=UPI0004147751|nr:transporter substrate-binding domain-containing protein [Chitinimonas koreensis]QNM97632.1 transporter substrate-binding domain-containing protein [Chitinimonas koreensis]